MPVKSRLYNFIACLKFFIKSRKGTFIYPMNTRRILIFLNTVWRAGFIFGYKLVANQSKKKLYFQKARTSILVYLKSCWYNIEDPVSCGYLVMLSRAARPRYMSYYFIECDKFRNVHTTFLLFTCFGLLTSEELFNFGFRFGGTVLCKFL